MKRCSKCNIEKPISEFHKNKLSPDGCQYWCKLCARQHSIAKYEKQYKRKKKALQEWRKTLEGKLAIRYYDMKARCSNPNHKRYKDYGGRGIKCLFTTSKEFVEYIFSELEIDRINNNGHYEPGNIRLTTGKENSNNRRNNVAISRDIN